MQAFVCDRYLKWMAGGKKWPTPALHPRRGKEKGGSPVGQRVRDSAENQSSALKGILLHSQLCGSEPNSGGAEIFHYSLPYLVLIHQFPAV